MGWCDIEVFGNFAGARILHIERKSPIRAKRCISRDIACDVKDPSISRICAAFVG